MTDQIAGHGESVGHGKNLRSVPGVARSNFVLKKGLMKWKEEKDQKDEMRDKVE